MSYIIKGETGDWEVVIGLEVHCEVISKAKLFSGAATASAPKLIRRSALLTPAFPACCP